MNLEPIHSDLSPREVFSRWPRSDPLAALWSGGPCSPGSPQARWTILARPDPTNTRLTDTRGRDARSALRSLVGSLAHTTQGRSEALGRVQSDSQGGGPDVPPFAGGWIGLVTYDLGRDLEPKVAGGSHDHEVGKMPGLDSSGGSDPAVRHAPCSPGADLSMFEHASRLVRCDDALAYDHLLRRWWSVGRGGEVMRACLGSSQPQTPRFDLGVLRSVTGREGFVASARRVLGYIRAGDAYQVNLAHRLVGSFSGAARGLFLSLAEHSRPRYGAYLELQPDGDRSDRRAVLSMSPELFLGFDARTRIVVTRPMKGTRPGGGSVEELRAAPKDNAELAMIVDLMRNDLGRVCSFGSVRVSDPRVIERHGPPATGHGGASGGVLQAVAEVRGRLRDGLGIFELLAATLPGGSVTGAPKVRAMQIIEELEPVPRGPYCGCIGYVSDDGRAAFNIAIRTAIVAGGCGPGGVDEIDGGTLSYSVGAGIVADSDPASEWSETLDKAGILRPFTRIADEA